VALEVEIWQKDIEGNMYADNEFLTQSKDESQNVLAGRVVHIPQAGAASGVKKNRSVFPAPVVKRADSDIVYVLDEYTSNPITIPNIETVQLSYDKRASVMAEDQAHLMDVMAKEMLNKWAGLASDNNVIIRTSGDARDAILTGATGKRKAFTMADIIAASKALKKQNLPKGGTLCGLLTPDMVSDIILDPKFQANSAWFTQWQATGTLPVIAGFKFYERSETTQYTAGGTTFRTYDDDGNLQNAAATDCASAMFWHSGCVERAQGTIKFFGRSDDPQYYGDIYSFLCMMGGRKRRADGKGIVQLIETPTT
jgi:hypothetical protein